MIQFYAPDIETELTLPEEEARHCVKVLRTRPGDMIEVIDGKGHRFSCRLTDDNPRHASVEIEAKTAVPLSWSTDITVAVAPTKNMDRMEWMVEKLTEIGINRIIPLHCRYSERKEIKIDRLQRIAVSAMKQSLKTVLPEIIPMRTFNEVVQSFAAAQKFIAYCDPSIPRKLLAREYDTAADSVLIFIGPEGDFSKDEIAAALSAGFMPVSLGENRLRTETAAIVACDTIHIINQLKQ